MEGLFSKPKKDAATDSAVSTPSLTITQYGKPIQVPNTFMGKFLEFEEENAKFREEKAKRDAEATAPIEEKRATVQAAPPKPSLNPAKRMMDWAGDISFSGMVEKFKLGAEILDGLTRWSPARRNEYRDRLFATRPGTPEFKVAYDEMIKAMAKDGVLGDVSGLKAVGGELADDAARGVTKVAKTAGLLPGTLPKKTLQEGQEYLTTSVLKKLEGKNLAGVQEVRDLLRGQGVTQRERQAVEESLAEFGDVKKVKVEDLKNAVQSRLLPLTPTHINLEAAGHAGTNLKKGQKPENADYGEIVYESPIKNSAGEQHYALREDYHFDHEEAFVERFRNDPDLGPIIKEMETDNPSSAAEDIYTEALDAFVESRVGVPDDVPGYFAHVRFEDVNTYMTDPGKVPERRILEIQSDLFQKDANTNIAQGDTFNLYGDSKGTVHVEIEISDGGNRSHTDIKDISTEEAIKEYPQFNKELTKYANDIKTLSPYSQNWHERVIREELRRAAKDGIKTVKFPTGETAAMIEGHTSSSMRWSVNHTSQALSRPAIKPGVVINDTNLDWVIVEALEDGKFKAVPINRLLDKPGVRANNLLRVEGNVDGYYDPQAAEIFDLKGSSDLTSAQISTRMREIDNEVKKAQAEFDAAQAELTEFKKTIKETSQGIYDLNGPLSTKWDQIVKRSDTALTTKQKLESERSLLQIRRNYETVFPEYIRKIHGEMRRVTDEFGIQWWEVDVTPADAGDVLSKKDEEDPQKATV